MRGGMGDPHPGGGPGSCPRNNGAGERHGVPRRGDPFPCCDISVQMKLSHFHLYVLTLLK